MNKKNFHRGLEGVLNEFNNYGRFFSSKIVLFFTDGYASDGYYQSLTTQIRNLPASIITIGIPGTNGWWLFKTWKVIRKLKKFLNKKTLKKLKKNVWKF